MTFNDKCPRCGRDVMRVVMRSGARALVDRQPDRDRGTILLVEDEDAARRHECQIGRAIALTRGEIATVRLAGDEDLFIHHRATCPHQETA